MKARMPAQSLQKGKIGRKTVDVAKNLACRARFADRNLVERYPRGRPEFQCRRALDLGLVSRPLRKRVLDAGADQSTRNQKRCCCPENGEYDDDRQQDRARCPCNSRQPAPHGSHGDLPSFIPGHRHDCAETFKPLRMISPAFAGYRKCSPYANAASGQATVVTIFIMRCSMIYRPELEE